MAPVETEATAAAVAMAEEAVATEAAADTAEAAEEETEADAVEVDIAEAVGVDMEAVAATEAATAVDVAEVATAATVVEIAGAMTEAQAEAGELEAHEAAWMAAEEEATKTTSPSPSAKEARVEDVEAATSARPTLPSALQPTARKATLGATARTPEVETSPAEALPSIRLATRTAVVRARAAIPRCTLAT